MVRIRASCAALGLANSDKKVLPIRGGDSPNGTGESLFKSDEGSTDPTDFSLPAHAVGKLRTRRMRVIELETDCGPP